MELVYWILSLTIVVGIIAYDYLAHRIRSLETLIDVQNRYIVEIREEIAYYNKN